jgi:polyisoprenoid-binding protein YceI
MPASGAEPVIGFDEGCLLLAFCMRVKVDSGAKHYPHNTRFHTDRQAYHMNVPHTLLPALAIAASLATNQAAANHPSAFDLAHSSMTVYVYKEGIFAFAADNHEINAPIVSGTFDEVANSVELNVDATKMLVLDRKLPPERRAKVQANMLGPQVLDTAKYPAIAYRSSKVTVRDASHIKIEGSLTLHGQTHPVEVQATKVDAKHFNGSATLRQSAFGITPIRIAGGTVRVKDEVKIEFAIALK